MHLSSHGVPEKFTDFGVNIIIRALYRTESFDKNTSTIDKRIEKNLEVILH